MATKTHIVWRKATEDELKNGSEEMIKISEEEIGISEVVTDKIDISNADLSSLTDEQLMELAPRLIKILNPKN